MVAARRTKLQYAGARRGIKGRAGTGSKRKYGQKYKSTRKTRRGNLSRILGSKTHSHKAIRRPCKNCKHTPALQRRNPSAHNHHGIGSFCRYHFRQPLGRRYCTSSGKRKKR